MSSLSSVWLMIGNSFSSISGWGECDSVLSGVYGSRSFLSADDGVEYVLVRNWESIRFTTTSPSIVRFDTNVHRSAGCFLIICLQILQIFFPSTVSWLFWSSIKLHMQMFKLSASTTLILTDDATDWWFSNEVCNLSGSKADADKLSLNFSVMAFKCFKHTTQLFGCFKPAFMTKFSLLESSWMWSQQLTIPWFDFIRNFKKTGCEKIKKNDYLMTVYKKEIGRVKKFDWETLLKVIEVKKWLVLFLQNIQQP